MKINKGVLYIILSVIGVIITLCGIAIVADGTISTALGGALIAIGAIVMTIFLCLNGDKKKKDDKKAKSISKPKSTKVQTSKTSTQAVKKQPQIIKRYNFDCTKAFYEKYERELKAFLVKVQFPDTFKEFLNKFRKSRKHYVITNDKKNYFEIEEVWTFDKLIEENIEYLCNTTDYFKQFKNVVVFGFDESGGHGVFFLSYEKDINSPMALFIDNESDIPVLLGNTIDEFLNNLTTVNDPRLVEIDLEHDIILGMQFNFEKCPNLKPIYMEYRKLHNRLYRDDPKAYDLINALEQGELSKQVFDEFHGKIKTLTRNDGKQERWSEVIGETYEATSFGQRRVLCGLLHANFKYYLPIEYYIDNYDDYPKKKRNNKRSEKWKTTKRSL